MLPDAKGEDITLAAGQSVTKNRSFAVQSGWDKDECKLAAFIQAGDKEILEGCVAELNQGVTIQSHTNNNSGKLQVKYIPETYMIYVPFTEKYTLSVSDIRGRVLEKTLVENGEHWYQIRESLPSGMHIVRVTTPDREVVRKVWFLR